MQPKRPIQTRRNILLVAPPDDTAVGRELPAHLVRALRGNGVLARRFQIGVDAASRDLLRAGRVSVASAVAARDLRGGDGGGAVGDLGRGRLGVGDGLAGAALIFALGTW